MKRYFLVGAIVLAGAELASVGCNAILGNESGILVGNDGSLGNDAPTSCGADQKNCGTCVALNQASLGCGGVCTVCPTPANAQATCLPENGIQTCAMGTCNSQFSDCDNDASDGCETHTTTNAHCGGCGTDCLQEFCERQGTGYVCSATCDPPNKECPGIGDAGTQCIDETTDTANCGGCAINCTVANGEGTCNDGGCAINCQSNYFLCAGKCVLPSNVQCGTSCTTCAANAPCDTQSGSPTYGTCVPNVVTPIDSGPPGCSMNTPCSGGNQACCSGLCQTNTDNQCGVNCTDCMNIGQTCDSTGTCVCSDCNIDAVTCGCTFPDKSCGAPIADPNCGACGMDCGSTGTCCCAGPVHAKGIPVTSNYSCSGTLDPDDSGACDCPPL